MTRQKGSTLEHELARRLKAVREEQPRQDPASLLAIRRMVFRKTTRRQLTKTSGAMLAATTAVLAVLAMPPNLAWPEDGGDDTRRATVAEVQQPMLAAADPWVAASARRSGIEGDGWIPRRWTP